MMKPRTFSKVFQHRRVLCFVFAILCFHKVVSAQDSTATDQTARPLGEIDIIRIQELHNITDILGDEIWPGFDTRKIPVAINNDDREELLIGHPNPPKEYHPFNDFELDGRPVMIRDGVNRYGPKGGGWAVEIGGKQAAYVSTLKEGRDTEGYLALILHECFHCFQKGYRQRAEGAGGELPEDDPIYSAMIGLESRILKPAVDEPNDENVRELAGMFVAVRHERRKDMPEKLIILEGEEEYNEGTANYSRARMYQLIVENGGITPFNKGKDPQYHGFPNAGREYRRMISSAIPPKGRPVTFFHSMYQHGMAQCLILDRVRPKWKEQMSEKGMTQFALLEKEFPLQEDTEKELLTKAKERFGYDDLLTEQTTLIDARLDLVRGYIDAPGRRYRIYHDRIRKRFKWKPFGPVYHVPESLEKELAEKRKKQGHDEEKIAYRRIVWAGGIRRFEKDGLVFESGDTPVVYGHEFIEWFDPDPAPDNSDMNIECENRKAETYVGVKIKTDGFTLEADKARIEWTEHVVRIYPIPE
ncbi:MAG: hypothetical protein JSW47_10950 [Phycisphaerales bacterium]|nr:MAG: hypothetical protein JSW47_10950 [Phycisphaerales bacterium]